MTLQFKTTLVALNLFLMTVFRVNQDKRLLLFSFYVWDNLDSLRINDKNENTQ